MSLPELFDPSLQAELEQVATEGIEIRNIVATWLTDQEFALDTLVTDLPDSEYNPDRYASMIYRPQEVDLSILIPRSGKLIVTGANSLPEIQRGLASFVNEVHKLGIELDPSVHRIKIKNIVSTGQFDTGVDLDQVALHLGLDKTEYEPEQFPGVIWKTSEGVVLLFSSGKYIITGVTSATELRQTNDELLAELEYFR